MLSRIDVGLAHDVELNSSYPNISRFIRIYSCPNYSVALGNVDREDDHRGASVRNEHLFLVVPLSHDPSHQLGAAYFPVDSANSYPSDFVYILLQFFLFSSDSFITGPLWLSL